MTGVSAPDIVDLAFTQKVKMMETKFKKFSEMLKSVKRVSAGKWELAYKGEVIALVEKVDCGKGAYVYDVSHPDNDATVTSCLSFMDAMSFIFPTFFVKHKIADMREFALSAIDNCRIRIQYFRQDKTRERWIIFNKHDKNPSIVYALSSAGISSPMWEPMHLGVISSAIIMFSTEAEAIQKWKSLAIPFGLASNCICKMSDAIAETCDHFGYLVMDCNTDLIKLNKQGFVR